MKLPSEFEARTLEWMGEETYRALEAALQTEPPVSIRVNRTKSVSYTHLEAYLELTPVQQLILPLCCLFSS